MLTTGVAALCGLIVGWGIRSMRQTSTAQQGASGDLPELLKVRSDHMLNLGLCPDHSAELELILACSLPDHDKYDFLLELSLIQSRCKHCVGKVFHREPTSGWQRTPNGKLVYRRLRDD